MLENQTKEYLLFTLGEHVLFKNWEKATSLPRFLLDIYAFRKTNFLGQQVLFLFQNSDIENTPASIQKQIQQIKSKWDGAVIFVAESYPTYDRRRLIEYKTSFILPDKILYLPEFGMVIKERIAERKRQKEFKALSPSAQLLLLYVLLHKQYAPQTPSQFASKLGYSAMTLTRTLDEIERAELANLYNKGRERFVEFHLQGRPLWEKALPLMRSPLKKVVWVYAEKNGLKYPKAGISALSEYSMIASDYDSRAVSEQEWKNNFPKKVIKEILPHEEPGATAIEIWKYDPNTLAQNGKVDPLSLFLSLQSDKDERTVGELNTMLEGVSW